MAAPRPLMPTVRDRGGGRGRALPPEPRPAGDKSRVPGFRLGPRQARYAHPVSGRARPPTTPGLRLQRVR
eukprot:1500559-Prymnesium_polylepis.1